MSALWLGFPPAEAAVPCGGATHRLRWEAGELRALDHDDPEGERALAALGGEVCTCVAVLDGWSRHVDDVRLLTLASRGGLDPLAASDEWLGLLTGAVGAPGWWASPATAPMRLPRRPAAVARRSSLSVTTTLQAVRRAGAPGPGRRVSQREQAENELIALLGLGGGVPDRLAATVAATWRDRVAARDRRVSRVRGPLRAALYGRALAAIRGWLGAGGLSLEVVIIPEGARPRLTRQDEVLEAKLPFGWLVDVWARGLPVVFGRFVLAAETPDGRSWTLTTVDAALGRPRTMTIELPH